MMTEEQNERLIRIDERVQAICDAKLIPRINRIEGAAVAFVALMTIIGIVSSVLDKEESRMHEKVEQEPDVVFIG
jgi:hypothetical protein